MDEEVRRPTKFRPEWVTWALGVLLVAVLAWYSLETRWMRAEVERANAKLEGRDAVFGELRSEHAETQWTINDTRRAVERMAAEQANLARRCGE